MYNFEYCQKVVVFRNNDTEVLLCKRKGEADYDGVFSFIGWKMDNADQDVLAGIKREIQEEIWSDVSLQLLPYSYLPLSYMKKNGNAMLLPHYYVQFLGWTITLSDEYSTYERVAVSELSAFEPKIATIPGAVGNILYLRSKFWANDLISL